MADLVVRRPEGLWCEAGAFYIDPWRPVARALITHAHADHARRGHERYLAAAEGSAALRGRLGAIALETLDWGKSLDIDGVRVSFHPAGHVLGAAQIRLEHRGQVWVLSGDYRIEADRSCTGFEPVACDVFVTESTFGLPVYRWPAQKEVFDEILRWWQGNVGDGRASVLYCYAFGKAQRILCGVADAAGAACDPGQGVRALPGPIVCHGAVETLNRVYREAGVALPPTLAADQVPDRALLRRALVLAPPSAAGSPWRGRFGDASDAFASGWMQVRGARRRRGVDRGFVLSDHADWPGLQEAITATGAERVIVTHGYEAVMVRWLQERGLQAQSFDTEYGQEAEEARASGESQGASGNPQGAGRAPEKAGRAPDGMGGAWDGGGGELDAAAGAPEATG